MRVVAIDWSGSRNPAYQRRHIWRADVIDGEVVSLRAGRTREEVVHDLIGTAAEAPDGLVVGLDFAFSLPGWYLERLGLDAPGLWSRLAGEALTPRMQALGLAGWVSDPEAPFWASRRSPETTGRAFRRTELEAAAPGIQPKSVFQLVGAGQVGPGSLHGMQALHRLSEAGFAIWPFHRPSSPLIVEIYPRVLIGRAPTRTEDDRGAYLAELPVDPSLRAIATQSVDAFDALVSAVRMAQHAHELRQLAVRPDDLPEGRIWKPAAHAATRSVAAVIDDYEAAWNEPDAERRAALLTSSCAAGVRYADPESDVTGLEALSAVIASFQTSYPGHVLRRASAVDAHHDLLRFSWLVERPDGTTMSGGLDACQLAPDGRLAVIAGFFGEL